MGLLNIYNRTDGDLTAQTRETTRLPKSNEGFERETRFLTHTLMAFYCISRVRAAQIFLKHLFGRMRARAHRIIRFSILPYNKIIMYHKSLSRETKVARVSTRFRENGTSNYITERMSVRREGFSGRPPRLLLLRISPRSANRII